MQNIKAIIFDLGGVLLDIDFKKVSDAFGALGVENFEQRYSQSKADLLFQKIESNQISEQEFINALKTYSDKPLNDQDIIDAWNAIFLDFRKESIDAIKTLRKKYRIFLLSNTNSIHYAAIIDIYNTTVNEGSFDSLFDKTYYSHETGFRKPDAAAYQEVLKENNLLSAEAVFIDDTIQNIEGAKQVGLQTIFLEKGMKVEDLDL